MLVATHPSMSGMRTMPELVAETPMTFCMNSGMNTTAPNIATPNRNAVAVVTLKIESRKSPSGITGSAARRSTPTKIPTRATPATARPTISGEPHAYVVPPHTATNSRHATAADSTPAPR